MASWEAWRGAGTVSATGCPSQEHELEEHCNSNF